MYLQKGGREAGRGLPLTTATAEENMGVHRCLITVRVRLKGQQVIMAIGAWRRSPSALIADSAVIQYLNWIRQHGANTRPGVVLLFFLTIQFRMLVPTITTAVGLVRDLPQYCTVPHLYWIQGVVIPWPRPSPLLHSRMWGVVKCRPRPLGWLIRIRLSYWLVTTPLSSQVLRWFAYTCTCTARVYKNYTT